MQLKKKFFVFAGVMGMIVAVISLVGYYNSRQSLQVSVENELRATVREKATELNGWLKEKKAIASSSANDLTAMDGDTNLLKRRKTLGTGTWDRDVLNIALGLEDGYFNSYIAQDLTGIIDPCKRPWYIEVKAKWPDTSAFYTAAYKDIGTDHMVVSAVAPVSSNGRFIGSICLDIALDTLESLTKVMNYHGEGWGIITEDNGNILATSGMGEPMQNIKDLPGIGEHFADMSLRGRGYVILPTKNDENMIFAYDTVPETKYFIGIAVPYDYVFAPLTNLKIIYGVLTLLGLVVSVGVCILTSDRITIPIMGLKYRANLLARGNLVMEKADVNTSDEIGELTQAFNTMQDSLRQLIAEIDNIGKQMSDATEKASDSDKETAASLQELSRLVEKMQAAIQKFKLS